MVVVLIVSGALLERDKGIGKGQATSGVLGVIGEGSDSVCAGDGPLFPYSRGGGVLAEVEDLE